MARRARFGPGAARAPVRGLPTRAGQRYGCAVSNALRPWTLLALALVFSSGSHADWRGGELRELRRFKAAEARQGVAVDAHHFYAIDSRAIGKYDKRTGERVGGYVDPDDGTIHHLNSGIVFDGRLYCAHSNYPGVPMLSSIEIFDAETLAHVDSHSFGMAPGSATWIDRRDGAWWVGFANYDGEGGTPNRGTSWTQIALYDDQWRSVGGYGFPRAVLDRLGTWSNSGSAFGPGGLLYATGHDAPELYVLRIPTAGAELEYVQSLSVAAEGQGLAWDPSEPDALYTLVRSAREVVVSKLTDWSD